ncbi:MAG: LacI family transcriptional regulator [Oscillospiraceae bacterium]|jgi:DNA-binding LacI/PurR family transcriptional regulator|nr:LacI family transcriptional regulator [Oscillospiraceae bacterium]
MATVKDIAKDCDVSIATVSKAINNHSDVSEKTKRRIMESAKRLGYHPNSQARFLKTNRTLNVGVVYEEKAHGGLTHQFFSSVLNSFKMEIERLGYDVTFISPHIGGTEEMSCYDRCMFRNVDGVLIVCADFKELQIQELLHSDLPLVSIDYSEDGLCSVLSDNSQGMQEIMQYCYQKGHRKIIYLYGDPSQVTDMRVSSFKQSAETLGVEILLEESRYHNPDFVEQSVKRLLRNNKELTCIICPDDYAALGAYNATAALNLKIPKDISIVGFDGIKISEVIKPHLTTYKQNSILMGQRAAFLLQRCMFKENIPADERVISVKGKLVEGETVGELSGAWWC